MNYLDRHFSSISTYCIPSDFNEGVISYPSNGYTPRFTILFLLQSIYHQR